MAASCVGASGSNSAMTYVPGASVGASDSISADVSAADSSADTSANGQVDAASDGSSSGGTSGAGTSSGAASGGSTPGVDASTGGTSSSSSSSGAGTSSSGGNSSGASGPTASGKLTGSVGGATVHVDYTGGKASIQLKHKLVQSGLACVPWAQVRLERGDGTCALTLNFEADETGVGALKAAQFEAKTPTSSNGQTTGMKACPGFIDPGPHAPGIAPMTFTLADKGNAKLPTPLLAQPGAGAKVAKPTVHLQPKGEAKLVYKNLTFSLNLGQLSAAGTALSAGDPALSCLGASTYVPLPKVALKDVNPGSKSYGKTVQLSDFKGKYVVVLAAAGWCGSCVAQAKYMHKIETQLKGQGRNDFQMLVLNDRTANSKSQQAKLSNNGQYKFPVLQGTYSTGWKTLVDCLGKTGKKNDAFIWAPTGQFIRKHEGKGTVYLNVFEDDVRQALDIKAATLVGCNCKNVYSAGAKIHHVACK